MRSRRISGWDLKFVWDDLFFALANGGYRLQYWGKGGAREFGLLRNLELKGKHAGQRAFVVGNGPSIATQNLRLLRSELTFFVNRGFLHKDYEYIRPTYHIFVDPKLATGEWPLTFLDEAAEKNPDVTFLLNAKWYNLPQFQPYKNRYKIYWIYQVLFFQRYFRRDIDLTRIGGGGAVVEQGILAAIYMGSKEVYFLGVDGTGLCHDMLKQSSHFYGVNPENTRKNFRDIYLDMAMASNSMRRWEQIGKYCARKGIRLVNLTAGGIMEFCPRGNYEYVLGQKRVGDGCTVNGQA